MDPVDHSPPGSSVHGISQARIQEWVAISHFRGSSKPRDEPRPPALVGGYLPLAFQVALVVKNPPANALDVKEVEAEVKVAQSYLTLCDPMDWILQARILEWVDIPFSSRSSQPRDQTQVSHIAGGFFTS